MTNETCAPVQHELTPDDRAMYERKLDELRTESALRQDENDELRQALNLAQSAHVVSINERLRLHDSLKAVRGGVPALEARMHELEVENERLRAQASIDGFVVVLTEAQTQLFSDLCTLLLSGAAKTQTVSALKLGLGASDNLVRSLRRRFEKALAREIVRKVPR